MEIPIQIEMTTKGFQKKMQEMVDLGFECWVEGKGDGSVVIKLEKEVKI